MQQSAPELGFIYLGALIGGWTATQAFKLLAQKYWERPRNLTLAFTAATTSALAGVIASNMLLMAAALFVSAPTVWGALVALLDRYAPGAAMTLRGDRRRTRVPAPDGRERRQEREEATRLWQRIRAWLLSR